MVSFIVTTLETITIPIFLILLNMTHEGSSKPSYGYGGHDHSQVNSSTKDLRSSYGF